MKALAAKGDRTSTGGYILGGSSTQYDAKRRPLSLDGDLASCGECEGGPFRILGRAETWLENGRYMVQHMDLVLCPCRRNRVIAGQDDYLISEGGGRTVTPTAASLVAVPTERKYDECVVLYSKETGEPLHNVHYRFLIGSSAIGEGVTDAQGRTTRVSRTSAETLRLQVRGI